MNGLLFLSSEDFIPVDTDQGKLLCTSSLTNGMLLVLFYSTQCEHCKKAIPVFKELPRLIQGCSFGMINVSTNAKVVHMSKTTIAPIQYVPLIVLYINGSPSYKYKGIITITEIQKFIIEMSSKLQTRQQFVKQSDELTTKSVKEIPAYCEGMPYCDEDVCYLEFDDAYQGKQQQQQQMR